MLRSIHAFVLVVCVTLASSAHALTLDGAGNITDWGFKPFTMTNQADVFTSGAFRTIANNYAPIDYPFGGHHAPSGGETYDLEEMHARLVGSTLQVLIVSSNGYTAGGFQRGDLFMELNGQAYGIVTHAANQGLVAGSVYALASAADTLQLQNASGSYLNINDIVANDYGPADEVRDIAGPWAVKGSIAANQKLSNTALITTATHSYGTIAGKNENNTHLFEYAIDLSGLIGNGLSFNLHQTWGCGNDVIELNGIILTSTDLPPVPSPAAGSIGLIGMALIGLARSRRQV